MFQLAASLALIEGSEFKVALITNALGRYSVKRCFEIDKILVLPSNLRVVSEQAGQLSFSNIISRSRLGLWCPFYGVNDRNFSAHLKRVGRCAVKDKLFLDGYFQRGWTFSQFDIARGLMAEMVTNIHPFLGKNNQGVVIHIRGGDYLTTESARVVDSEYYRVSLEKIRLLNPEILRVTVVSDDMPYACAVIEAIRYRNPGLIFDFVPSSGGLAGASWISDFMLLRNAPARIIGNSSFAWWAAALDANMSVTFSPSRWTVGFKRDLFLPWERVIGSIE